MKMLTKDLEERVDDLHDAVGDIDDTIDMQKSIIEDAEACVECLDERRWELVKERCDLESSKTECDATSRQVGETILLSTVLGGYSVVRDPREKLRFSNHDDNVFVITNEGVWGCRDLFPHKDSELVFLTEVVE
jgi:hypothetical protein